MQTKRLVMMVLGVFILVLLSTNVKADPLTLTLTNPNQSGVVGNILNFGGSVTNLAPPSVQIVSSQFTFNDGGGTLLFDDSAFLNNFFLQSVAAGSTLGPFDMFTVEILPGAAPGVYTGVFSVLYDNGTVTQETNVFTFSVTVQPSTALIPEPATLVLFGTGLIGLLKLKRTQRA